MLDRIAFGMIALAMLALAILQFNMAIHEPDIFRPTWVWIDYAAGVVCLCLAAFSTSFAFHE